MIRSVYNAGMGMLALQKKQENISNNLANLETPAFKARTLLSEASFSALISNQAAPGGQWTQLGAMNMGTSVSEVYTDHTQGILLESGANLDFALEGPGFFQVDTPQGMRLTRNGRFHLSGEGYLADERNNPVLAAYPGGGSGYLYPNEGTSLAVSAAGEVVAGGETLGRLLVVEPADPGTLTDQGDGYFEAAALLDSPVTAVRQGFTEQSNVAMADQLIQLMTNTSLLSSNQRVLSTLDETLGRAVNELGRLG